MSKELYAHRLKTPLEKGLRQGKRYFFMYGDGIKDCFLEGIYKGIYSLSETLKYFFLGRDDCRYFVTANTDGVRIFMRTASGIEEITQAYLSPPKVDDDMPDDEEEAEHAVTRKQSGEARSLEQSIQGSGVNIVNQINIVKHRTSENRNAAEKTAVFFEDFEWLAKLYSSNNDASLEYIKILKDFMKIDECYILTSLEDIELLKKYNFETKGSNIIFLGNPSAKEVQYTFLRHFFRKTVFGGTQIQINLFQELDEVAQAISASKKSLREAIQVFDTIVVKKNKKEINQTDFEVAIEKITAEKVRIDDVIIEGEEKRKILDAVDSFINNDDSREYRKGFILTGPPGTGKTQIARAIANEKKCYFMAPTLSDLKGEYVGHSSAKVKRIFDEARANAPTIMFIDEADTVFPSRDLGVGGSDSFNLDMVNQFLQEIDGMASGKAKIFVIAATNRPNIIDSAIQSRLSERIPIHLPSAANRIRIFDLKLKKYNFSIGDKPYRSEIESKTVNMSGRDIDNFVKKLKEYIPHTPFRKIENLSDNEESRQVLLKILGDNERVLIEDLQRSVPVEVMEPDKIESSYGKIIGYEGIKNRIRRQGDFIRSAEREKLQAKQYGVRVSKGVLLYGPPGNAKTKLAEATAKENNFYFVKVLSKDFASDSIAKQLDNLQIIFNQTLRLSKMCSKYDGVLLFFDEFDSLAGMQMGSIIRGTLLDYLASGESQENTGIRSAQSRIMLMAATNFKDRLDEAVIRKGRIDEHIYMDNPTETEGRRMLRAKFREDPKIEFEDESLTDEIYSRLLDQKRAEFSEKIAGWGNLGDEQREELLRLQRPSGADIINLFDEIKSDMYFSQRSSLSQGGKLVLSENLINEHFDNV